jgi:prepilin-type processing-associated H-X9-DG protein
MTTMGRLEFGRLTDAWAGEASDFTPLLANQLGAVGDAIQVDLTSIGQSEVLTAGGRRIDIVAEGEDGAEFVIENQFGRGDHDHLTRGLAYAVARRARGLVVIAEEHRDEFRAVAQYLNELAEHDEGRGIAVWLVEAKAVRIGESLWAPLFTAVVEPNSFTATVEQARRKELPASLEEFWKQFDDPESQSATQRVVYAWLEAGHRTRLGPNHIVLEASGPSKSGRRTVAVLYADGHVMVPFHSYAGVNSGIPVDAVTTDEFRARADTLFGFDPTSKIASTVAGWVKPGREHDLLGFCQSVAEAYAAALQLQES